jgi:hypothetical protein
LSQLLRLVHVEGSFEAYQPGFGTKGAAGIEGQGYIPAKKRSITTLALIATWKSEERSALARFELAE